MSPKGHFVTLPGSKPALPESSPFPTGSTVYLKRCPSPPGIVRGVTRAKVLVFWPDLKFTGKHPADALVLAGPAGHGDRND